MLRFLFFVHSDCLQNEVLTHTLGEKKISRVTLGSLEDLGYVVNYTAADPYGQSILVPVRVVIVAVS